MTRPPKVVLDQDRPLWEQQDGETETQYRYFTAFKDMDPRSLKGGIELGLFPGYARDLSSTWSWAERALEWDRHVARETQAQLVRERVAMNLRHRTLAREGLVKIKEWLDGVEIATLKPNEAARWFWVLIQAERLASGSDIPGTRRDVDQPALPRPDGVTADGGPTNPLDDMSLAEIMGLEPGQEREALQRLYDGLRNEG